MLELNEYLRESPKVNVNEPQKLNNSKMINANEFHQGLGEQDMLHYEASLKHDNLWREQNRKLYLQYNNP